MCDKFSGEEKTSPKVVTSSSTPLLSLPSTLLPFNTNGNDLSQFNYLVNLIAIPMNGINIETNHALNDKKDTKRVKHRQTERIRHKKIIELISQLNEKIGINGKHETQSNVLTRTARYALFLSYVTEKLEKEFDDKINISFDAWLSEMYDLYRKANDKVSLLVNGNINTQNNCYKNKVESQPEAQQTPPKECSAHYKRETSLKTPDHCLPLKKRAKMIMFSDLHD